MKMMNAIRSLLVRPPSQCLSLFTSHKKPLHAFLCSLPSPELRNQYFPRNFRPKHVIAPVFAKTGGPQNSRLSEDDGTRGSEALVTVLKLYSAIKNQNLNEISDLIGEECRILCNFISSFQPVRGKKQVLDFFNALTKLMGRNIEIVIKPTSTEGMIVSISWRLECRKTHAPLGKGFSFHICQFYKGKIYISNVEMFMEPLFHLEPLRMKIIIHMMNFVEKIGTGTCTIPLKKTQRVAILVFLVLILAAFSAYFI